MISKLTHQFEIYFLNVFASARSLLKENDLGIADVGFCSASCRGIVESPVKALESVV